MGVELVDVAVNDEADDLRKHELVSVYRQDGDRLWRAIFAFAQSREIADDSVAEAFAQALRRRTEINDIQAWVWRSAFRIAAGELKARGRGHPGQPEQITQLPEGATELVLALAQLSYKQRASVVLHYYAGYSTQQVAEIIGSTSQAVRVHLFRARKRLQTLLEVQSD
jgi:RNA polymerase sigma factor (sigma-70 family)